GAGLSATWTRPGWAGISTDDDHSDAADCATKSGSAGVPEIDRWHYSTLPLGGRRLQRFREAARNLPPTTSTAVARRRNTPSRLGGEFEASIGPVSKLALCLILMFRLSPVHLGKRTSLSGGVYFF